MSYWTVVLVVMLHLNEAAAAPVPPHRGQGSRRLQKTGPGDIRPEDFDLTGAPSLSDLHWPARRGGVVCVASCLALVTVHSHAKDWLHRLMWRATVLQFFDHDTDLGFVIASPENDTKLTKTWLQWEQDMYSDLILLDMPEMTSAAAMGGRVFKSFQWVTRVAGNKYEWLVKADQDTLVQPIALRHMLLGVPRHKALVCRSCFGREGESDNDRCNGPLYAVRIHAARTIINNTSPNLNMNQNEDHMITRLFQQSHNASALCWLPHGRVHDPLHSKQKSIEGWASPFTFATVGLHLMKIPSTFREAFVLMAPIINAWRACELSGFSQHNNCSVWRESFYSSNSCNNK
jgi:hypothetical protein